MVHAAMRLADDERQKALPRRFKFNVASLEAVKVPPGKDRIWVYDSIVQKLAFMRTATGATSFYWISKIDRRVVRYRLGDGTMPVEQARKLAQAVQGKAAEGINPQAVKQTLRSEQSFGAVWQWYMDQHVKPRLRTADEIQQKYDKHLKGWASRKFNSITRSDVAALHGKIGAETPGAANRLVRLLSSLFNRARDIGYDKVNPASGIRMYPENKRERFLQPDELPKFYMGLQAVSQDMRDLFELALYTGARIGNIRSMEWSEINHDAATWTIPAAKFKTGKAVTVPLVAQALVILDRRRKEYPDNAFVFPSIGANGHIEEHKKAWSTVCEKAGLSDLHAHDLRHSLASWQAGLGANLSTIGRSLGHANSATTARYSHVHLDPVRASVKGAVDAMVKASKAKPRKAASHV